jgi:hypothetical protein
MTLIELEVPKSGDIEVLHELTIKAYEDMGASQFLERTVAQKVRQIRFNFFRFDAGDKDVFRFERTVLNISRVMDIKTKKEYLVRFVEIHGKTNKTVEDPFQYDDEIDYHTEPNGIEKDVKSENRGGMSLKVKKVVDTKRVYHTPFTRENVMKALEDALIPGDPSTVTLYVEMPNSGLRPIRISSDNLEAFISKPFHVLVEYGRTGNRKLLDTTEDGQIYSQLLDKDPDKIRKALEQIEKDEEEQKQKKSNKGSEEIIVKESPKKQSGKNEII